MPTPRASPWPTPCGGCRVSTSARPACSGRPTSGAMRRCWMPSMPEQGLLRHPAGRRQRRTEPAPRPSGLSSTPGKADEPASGHSSGHRPGRAAPPMAGYPDTSGLGNAAISLALSREAPARQGQIRTGGPWSEPGPPGPAPAEPGGIQRPQPQGVPAGDVSPSRTAADAKPEAAAPRPKPMLEKTAGGTATSPPAEAKAVIGTAADQPRDTVGRGEPAALQPDGAPAATPGRPTGGEGKLMPRASAAGEPGMAESVTAESAIRDSLRDTGHTP